MPYSWPTPGQTLEWVAFPFSRGSSQPRDQAQVCRIAGRFFTGWATREAQEYKGGLKISWKSKEWRLSSLLVMFRVRDASEKSCMQAMLAWFQSCSAPKEKTLLITLPRCVAQRKKKGWVRCKSCQHLNTTIWTQTLIGEVKVYNWIIKYQYQNM